MKHAVPVRDRILDISVNLARVGNWTADAYKGKRGLIRFFLDQTKEYIKEVRRAPISAEFKLVLESFQREFEKLQRETVTEENKDWWAERALTWANILQHRAKLA